MSKTKDMMITIMERAEERRQESEQREGESDYDFTFRMCQEAAEENGFAHPRQRDEWAEFAADIMTEEMSLDGSELDPDGNPSRVT